MKTQKVLVCEQVGAVAWGLFRWTPQGDTQKQDMRAVWWLTLHCGHRRQCVAIVPPDRFACLECDDQLKLPLELPAMTESWR